MELLTDPEIEIEKKNQGRVEFNFPLLTIRTRLLGGFFDRFGSFRISRYASWIALVIVPIVAAIGLYLLSSSLFTLLWTPAARDVTRELGPATYLLLPGINPLLPIFYGWLAIVLAIVIHEGAHGIIARNRGLKVKSSGLLFFLIIPIGAFVDVDEEQIAKAKPRDSSRIMAAGVGGNIVAAIACLIAVLIIVNGLTPIVNGVYISNVTEGMPAETAGIQPGDIFISIDNVLIDNYDILNSTLSEKNPGDIIQVTVARGDMWKTNFTTTVELTERENRTVMGIAIADLQTDERLNLYKTVTPETLSIYLVPPSLYPGLVPFSDSFAPFYTHDWLLDWQAWSNFFFWVWFVNVNVAVFNALPIYPLDGGRIFDIALKSVLKGKMKENTISKITYAVTIILVIILLMIAIIPFIL